MGLFSRKEKVPEIPPAPKLPELPKIQSSKNNSNELPSFPSNFGENLNREMVKSAVDDSSDDNFEDRGEMVEQLPQNFRLREELRTENNELAIPEFPIKSELPSQTPEFAERRTLELSPSIQSEKKTHQVEPIFVRIDKFQSAKKDFDEIKKNVWDIETTLKKINETRLKEEEEISGWMQELEKIKSRLSEIDTNIFNKI